MFEQLKFKYPVYDPCAKVVSIARRWLFDRPFTTTQDIKLALSQPFSIAAVHVFYNDPSGWPGDRLTVEDPKNANSDLSEFDLVLVMEMENHNWEDIQNWISKQNFKRYIFSHGTISSPAQETTPNMFYNNVWLDIFLEERKFIDTNTGIDYKPFKFNALLGTRRPHRDYIMLAMAESGLLEQNIVTYRDVFLGDITNFQTKEFQSKFPNTKLLHPYVSPLLQPSWEVAEHINHQISFIDPVEIHLRTWYSIVAETNGLGPNFFLTEKTMKQLWAKRVFVMFGNSGFLHNLRKLGFETFGDVIDESYDIDEHYNRDWKRFEKAFEQVKFLDAQDPIAVYKKLSPVLEHNHHHLAEVRKRSNNRGWKLLLQVVVSKHWEIVQ